LYEQKIALYEGLGKVLWQHADLAESTAVYEQMRLTAEAAGDVATQARAWNDLCQVHESAGDHRAVLKDARHAEEMAEKAGDAALLATALINQGFASFRLGNMGQTLALGEQAMRLAEESDVTQVIISVLHLLGGAYDLLGAYDRAVQYQEQALALCRKQEDLYRIAGSLNNIGENARLRGDYETAVSYFQEALALSRKVGARNGAMVIRASMGGARAGLGQYEAAERDLRQVIQTSRAVGERFARMYAYLFLAEALLGQEKMPQALAAARHALALGQETGLQECTGGAWRALGMIAATLRQPIVVSDEKVDAAACFHNSVQLFTEMGALGERKRTMEVWRQYDPASAGVVL
jgi:tetratricopeptide (TPR) repeat protein